jgi:selenide, water dikinase
MPDGTVAVDVVEGTPSLTSLASGAGCGCKLPAADVLGLLDRIDGGAAADERLLVGFATSDDAAVYRISEELALVQTVDFFTPPVDDPYDFGRIAAANALSDVYAMGGTPMSALNVLAFPLAVLGPGVLGRVLEGGAAIAREARTAIVGGHSIEDPEPKYGLAVTGVVDPRRMVTNAGGANGDALVLTKPLGVGAVMAARKHGRRDARLLESAIETMVALNARAAREAVDAGAHAMTDVTGFGLLGHLHHLCRESGLAAELDAQAVPHLDGVAALLEDGSGLSGGSRRNADWAASFARLHPSIPLWRRRLLADPATSGGLLVALAPERAGELEGTLVGRLLEGAPGTIDVI